MKWLIPISLAVLGGTAHADQCQVLDAAQAYKAASILAGAPHVIDFCEPCGDQVPGIPEVAHRVEVVGTGTHELAINGRTVDLAYTYVQTSPRQYTNLAALAGCEATGVSPTLAVADETRSGVLITASDTPVAKPHVVRPGIAPPPAPAVYVYSTTRHEIPWLAIAFAAGGGVICGATWMLLLVATRRRRAMRPRAVELRH